jgi:hypothetical protein
MRLFFLGSGMAYIPKGEKWLSLDVCAMPKIESTVDFVPSGSGGFL